MKRSDADIADAAAACRVLWRARAHINSWCCLCMHASSLAVMPRLGRAVRAGTGLRPSGLHNGYDSMAMPEKSRVCLCRLPGMEVQRSRFSMLFTRRPVTNCGVALGAGWCSQTALLEHCDIACDGAAAACAACRGLAGPRASRCWLANAARARVMTCH